MVTACIPSRGLIHSRTIESILSNIPVKLAFTHDLPIPQAFNEFLSLEGDLWFVEEDIEVSANTLRKLVDLDTDIATANYNLETGKAVQKIGNYILGGTGCTLIRRRVFDKIGEFRVDVEYDYKTLMPHPIEGKRIYGKHDTDFYIRAQDNNFSVGVIDEDVRHMRIEKYGARRDNNGWHTIKYL